MSKDFEEVNELYKLPTADLQGDVGEVLTASRLRNESDLRVIRNVYLPYNEVFCEVDIIAISKSGIFVIENKNYKGLVIGSNLNYYWDVMYPSSKRLRLYNPIRQNTKHKEVVKVT